MDYRALYRKYRPSSFSDVSGQEVAVTILKNSIKNNKISHAYLFYGPRGTGKTSLAKIFARAVNCSDPKDGIQCEKCDNCLISSEKECVDIIEIDAASNNGVDEIRDLKSKISFVPANLKYKVYIIDEVHMLSAGAFNALLKTIEEPPSYVIFILATTEFSKVPTTIVSRCQTIEFKKISDNNISSRISKIAKDEKIKISEEAIEEIAKNANGGLRDSIGLLEKANSFSNNISADDIRTITGNVSSSDRDTFIKYMLDGNINEIIKMVNEFYDAGIDLNKFVNDLISNITDKYILNTNNIDTNMCSIVRQLDSTYTDMINSSNPKLILEVSLLNIISTSNKINDISTKSVVEKKEEPKKEVKEVKKIEEKEQPKNKEQTINNDQLIKTRVYNTIAKADKKIINDIKSNWSKLNDLAFDDKYGNISRILVSDTPPVAASDEYIVLCSKLKGISEQVNNDLINVEKICEIIFNYKYKVVCISEVEWNEYKELYKKDKSLFVYKKEEDKTSEKDDSTSSIKDVSKELFED